MARKDRFPPEPDTAPKTSRSPTHRHSAPAPKRSRESSEAPTLPPPAGESQESNESPTSARSGRGGRRKATPRASNIRASRPRLPAATVDEVTADLSKDPRRERDEDD